MALMLRLLPRSAPPRDLALPVAALLGMGAWVGLSLIWTGSAERTYLELTRIGHYLGLLVLIALLVDRRTWKAALAGLTAGGVAICALAVLSRTAPSVFAPDPAQEFFHSGRLSTPFGYWNALGAWSAIVVPMALAWSVHARGRRLRALSLAAIPFVGAALYLSYSRGALIACAVGVVILIALTARRRRTLIHAGVAGAAMVATVAAIRGSPEIATGSGGDGGAVVLATITLASLACAVIARRRRSGRPSPARLHVPAPPRGLVIAGVVALLGAIVAFGPEAASGVRDSFAERASSADADPAARLTSFSGQRQRLWSSAVDAFADSPVGGIGAGTFEFWWSRNGEDPRLVRDAHSLYLETAAEQGVIGLLLLLALVGGLIRSGALTWRDRRTTRGAGAAAAALAASGVFLVSASADWMWELTAVGALGLAPMVIAAGARSQRLRRRKPGPRVRFALIAAALALGAIQVPGIVSSDRMRASESSLRSGDAGLALELAEQATDAAPWGAGPYMQRAMARAALSEPAAFRRDVERARDREPDNWRHPLALATIEFRWGNELRAERAYAEARELLPTLPIDRDAVLAALGSGATVVEAAAAVSQTLIRE